MPKQFGQDEFFTQLDQTDLPLRHGYHKQYDTVFEHGELVQTADFDLDAVARGLGEAPRDWQG